MAGKITFTPSEADYIEAARVHLAVALRRPRARRKRVILVLIMMLAGLGLGLTFMPLRDVWMFVAAYGVIGILIPPFAIAVARVMLPRRIRRLYQQQRALNVPHEFEWNDVGTSYRSDIGHNTPRWADFHGWSEGRGAFLLLLNEQLYQFVPKRALSAAQMDDLRRTLETSAVAQQL